MIKNILNVFFLVMILNSPAIAANNDKDSNCSNEFLRPYAVYIGDSLHLTGNIEIKAAGGNLLVGKGINSHAGGITTGSDIYVGKNIHGIEQQLNVHILGCKQVPADRVSAPRDYSKATWIFRADGTAVTPFGTFSGQVNTPSGGTWQWMQADGSDPDLPQGTWYWTSDGSITPLSGQVAVLSSLKLSAPIFIQGSLQVFGTLQARSDLSIFSLSDLGLYVQNSLHAKEGSINVQGYSWVKMLHLEKSVSSCNFEGGIWIDQNANIGANCRVNSSVVTLTEALKHIDTPSGMEVATISLFKGADNDTSGYGFAVFITNTATKSMDEILNAIAVAAETNTPLSPDIIELVRGAQTKILGTSTDRGVDMGEIMALPALLYSHFFIQKMLREQVGALTPILTDRIVLPNGTALGEFAESSGPLAGSSLGWYALDITDQLVATDSEKIQFFLATFKDAVADYTDDEMAEAKYARYTEWASTLGDSVSPSTSAPFSAMSIYTCDSNSTTVELISSSINAPQPNRNFPSAYCINLPYTVGCAPTAGAAVLAYAGCRKSYYQSCQPAQVTVARNMANKMQTGDPRRFPCNLYAWSVPWAANATCPLAIGPGFVAAAESYGMNYSSENYYTVPQSAGYVFDKIAHETDFGRPPLVDLGADPAWGNHTVTAFGYKIYHTPSGCYDRHYFYAFSTWQDMRYHRIDWYSTGETFWGFHALDGPSGSCAPDSGGGGGGGCASSGDKNFPLVFIAGLFLIRLLRKPHKLT